MGYGLILWASMGHAEVAPPDYAAELGARAAAHVEALNSQDLFHEAVNWGRAFERRVTASPDLSYEVAFALNALGRRSVAEAEYRKALARDSENAAAWYDLGELLLLDGDLAEAQEVFAKAASLRPDHWAAWFRLADVAGRRQDSEAFERYLRLALREGFSFTAVVDDPHWKGFYHAPDLGGVMRRLITVYGDESLLLRFEEP